MSRGPFGIQAEEERPLPEKVAFARRALGEGRSPSGGGQECLNRVVDLPAQGAVAARFDPLHLEPRAIQHSRLCLFLPIVLPGVNGVNSTRSLPLMHSSVR